MLIPGLATANRRRVTLAPSLFVAFERHVLAQLGNAVDPDLVPFDALRAMGRHSVAYLAERTLTGIVQRPDLYAVAHDDKSIKAETEAWLWPILPELARAYARAFVYGSAAVGLTWAREPLRFRVPSADGKSARRRTLAGHSHYVAVRQLPNAAVSLELDAAGRVLAVLDTSGGAPTPRYPFDASAVFVWDPEPEQPFAGRGALRRAWPDLCKDTIVQLIRDKALERNVSPPRVGHAPVGETDVGDGQGPRPNLEVLADIMDELQGLGSAALPSVPNGQAGWDISLLEASPAAAETFDRALARGEARILMAFLLTPSMGGLEDLAATASKTLQGALQEFVQDLATAFASALDVLVRNVHEKNHTLADVEAPTIRVTDVGKAGARKTLLTLLQLANAAPISEIAHRLNTPEVLETLGAPVRAEAPAELLAAAAAAGQKAPQGRPEAPAGDRQQRREDAITDAGEEAVGAPGEGDAAG